MHYSQLLGQLLLLQVDLKQFEGMAVQHARKNKEQEEDDLDLKNRRAPKTQKDKALKEVCHCQCCLPFAYQRCAVSCIVVHICSSTRNIPSMGFIAFQLLFCCLIFTLAQSSWRFHR